MARKKSPNRSQLEIKMDILNALFVNGGLNRTRLMYKSNMAWNQLLDNINQLMSFGCINVDDINSNRPVYMLTTKGIGTLENYKKVIIAVGEIVR